MAASVPNSAAVAGPAALDVQALEQSVRRRRAPAGVGTVDDVVVHERRGVEEFERGGGRDDGEAIVRAVGFERVERVRAHPLPAPIAEQCPETLATAEKPP